MSFAPLPEIFLKDLERCRASDGLVLDLGCGDGAFLPGAEMEGARVVRLDRLAPAAGTAADLVGDATTPPLREAVFDLVVAANLFRHIVSRESAGELLARWTGLVRPGGALYLFEDEPAEEPAAARNYRLLQEFLLELMPDRRGALMPLRTFREQAGEGWRTGTAPNKQTIDAQAVCALLAGDGRPGRRARRLIESITNEGIDCGTYWWACRRREAATGKAT